VLSACSSLPAAGPDTSEIYAASKPQDDRGLERFLIVPVVDTTIAVLKRRPIDSMYDCFGDRRGAPDVRIGTGDTVAVTIWEAAAGGLFSPQLGVVSTGAPSTNIPQQQVGRDGTINVPFAGRIRVVGMTPAEVERAITNKLAGRAIEPQVLVTLPTSVSNNVTVTGEGTAGARVPISERGDRLLDVIATVGGLKNNTYDSWIRLTRRGKTLSVPFANLLSNPRENIYVQPQDIVTVVRQPKTFTAFGATGQNASIEFQTTKLTLEGAVAKSGGLLDMRADPEGVYLFRNEPIGFAHQLTRGPLPALIGDTVPVIYKLDMRDPRAYLLARDFEVQDKDILYVANSASTAVSKFAGLIATATQPVQSITTAAQRVNNF